MGDYQHLQWFSWLCTQSWGISNPLELLLSGWSALPPKSPNDFSPVTLVAQSSEAWMSLFSIPIGTSSLLPWGRRASPRSALMEAFLPWAQAPQGEWWRGQGLCG